MTAVPDKIHSFKRKKKLRNKAEKHKRAKTHYQTLVELADRLVPNAESFICPICLDFGAERKGVILQECLHTYCRPCLSSTVEYSETVEVKCPFADEMYSCESHLQDLEIKSLVTSEMYEAHLQRSITVAESSAENSFHCKTADCRGWCLFEAGVQTFRCDVCGRTNCLLCCVIHEGKSCQQYKEERKALLNLAKSEELTEKRIESMIRKGIAMNCPKCKAVMKKDEGCDWCTCTMCRTEICWATKGPRWGPGGRGDTSGGCRCDENGQRCHPKCGFCH